MTWSKRLTDVVLAALLLVLLAPLMAGIALWLWWREGGPVLYLSERMATPEQGFILWKFRTMRPVSHDSGVSGGDKAGRITPTGAWLRRTRLDEVPQLVNVLRGDMSFVGPRPPVRRYVDLYPELYAQVLAQRPGVTGLASLVFHKTEERLLSACLTPSETEAVYCRRCIPRKAKLDLIYARNRTFCGDIRLMFVTIMR